MRWNNSRFETQARKAMIHRHLNHQELSLAAIDDVIARGKRKDGRSCAWRSWIPGENTTGVPRAYRRSTRATLSFLDALCRSTPHCLIHMHKPFSEIIVGTRFFNPGYAGKSRFGMERSVAILHCGEKGIRAE
jgi:hypothetical protein